MKEGFAGGVKFCFLVFVFVLLCFFEWLGGTLISCMLDKGSNKELHPDALGGFEGWKPMDAGSGGGHRYKDHSLVTPPPQLLEGNQASTDPARLLCGD